MIIMKRSAINNAITVAKTALESISFCLPRFANWDMAEWQANESKIGTIRDVMLGWDVTDFGTDDFKNVGAVLFTVRNGNLYNEHSGVPYCEKVIVFNDEEKQVIPLHFHRNKTEDIINRGNGIMEIELFQSTAENTIDKLSDVMVYRDGIEYCCKAGEVYELFPGESITLKSGIYHRFGCKKGGGNLVVGEVSKINDDNNDNIFAEKQQRFSAIVEDDIPKYLLCNEYNLIK